MKKKLIIEIYNCGDCEHCFLDIIRIEHKCRHPKAEYRARIRNFPKIPSWCPLEDVEDV